MNLKHFRKCHLISICKIVSKLCSLNASKCWLTQFKLKVLCCLLFCVLKKSFRIYSNKKAQLESSFLKGKLKNFQLPLLVDTIVDIIQFSLSERLRVEKKQRWKFIVKRIEMGQNVYISKMRMRIQLHISFYSLFWKKKSILMLLLSFLIYMTTNFQTMKNSLTKKKSRFLLFLCVYIPQFFIVFSHSIIIIIYIVFHHLNLWTF